MVVAMAVTQWGPGKVCQIQRGHAVTLEVMLMAPSRASPLPQVLRNPCGSELAREGAEVMRGEFTVPFARRISPVSR
ncbi:hypothetical protein EMIT0P43_80055 [Pseudomonas jessenii]